MINLERFKTDFFFVFISNFQGKKEMIFKFTNERSFNLNNQFFLPFFDLIKKSNLRVQ